MISAQSPSSAYAVDATSTSWVYFSQRTRWAKHTITTTTWMRELSNAVPGHPIFIPPFHCNPWPSSITMRASIVAFAESMIADQPDWLTCRPWWRIASWHHGTSPKSQHFTQGDIPARNIHIIMDARRILLHCILYFCSPTREPRVLQFLGRTSMSNSASINALGKCFHSGLCICLVMENLASNKDQAAHTDEVSRQIH